MASHPQPSPLSSWPLEKYSYSAAPLSSTPEPPWSHFAHRDNIFLVIDSQRAATRVQQSSGTFFALQVLLKVVWGAETLEALDLTTLTQEKIPRSNPLQSVQPALVVLGRSPCIAIKYYKRDDQTIRRFQLRFVSDSAYTSAKVLLEQANCPVKQVNCPVKQAIGGGNDQYSQFQAQLPPTYPLNYFSPTPRGTSFLNYEHNSSRIHPPEPSPYFGNSSPSQSREISSSSSSSTATVVAASSPDLAFRGDYRSIVPFPSFTRSNTTDDALPPPRPPTESSAFKKTATQNFIAAPALEDLPPLRKPTPARKPLTLAAQAPIASRILSLVSSGAHHMRSPTSRTDFGGSVGQVVGGGKVNTNREYGSGMKEHNGNLTNTKDSTLTSGMARTVGTDSIVQSSEAVERTEGDINNKTNKRKRSDVDSEEQGRDNQKKNERKVITDKGEEEDITMLERMIVEALDDEDFVKLLEKVARVWQRVGFETMGRNIFRGKGNAGRS